MAGANRGANRLAGLIARSVSHIDVLFLPTPSLHLEATPGKDAFVNEDDMALGIKDLLLGSTPFGPETK